MILCDTGPIVARERVALEGTETTPDLEARLATIAADLLARSHIKVLT